MKSVANIALIVSLILFSIFITNVYLGSADKGVFLSEVHEVKVLFSSVLAFVVGILIKAAEQESQSKGL